MASKLTSEQIKELVTDLHKQINEELATGFTAYESAVIRLEMMMTATKLGTLGMLSILMKQTMNRDGLAGGLKFVEGEKHIEDIHAFCVYMMLAQVRIFQQNKPGSIADFMQGALEIFALENDRAFPYLSLIEGLLKRIEEQ